MATAESNQKTNTLYVAGILALAICMQFSTYGPGIAMPTKLRELDGMAFYALCTALGSIGTMLILPMVGKLYNIFGMRTIIITGVVMQFIARIGMMAAPSVVPFMVLYALQAMGGGMYISAAYVMMAGAVSSEKRPKFYGYIATSNAIGALLGPLVCGQIVDAGFVDFAFIAYIPFALVAIICIFRFAPNRKEAGAAAGFDFIGVVLLVAAVCCIMFWMNLGGKSFAWNSLPSIAMILVGIVALISLIRRESTIENPSVPIKMFKKKRLTASFLGQVCLSCYSTCTAAYCVNYIQNVLLSGNAMLSGTATMPQTIVIAVLGIFIGRYLGKDFVRRFRPMGILAFLCPITATLILFSLKPESSMLQIWIATGIGGVSSAIAQSSFAAFFQTELKPEEFAPAQSMYNFGSTTLNVPNPLSVYKMCVESERFWKLF